MPNAENQSNRENMDWHYLENQFYNAVKGSKKKSQDLFKTHYGKLLEEASNPDIQALLDVFEPQYTESLIATADWLDARGRLAAATVDVTDKQDELQFPTARDWSNKIEEVFPKNSSAYVRLFPRGREPFQKGTRSQRMMAVLTLSRALLDGIYQPVFADLQAEVAVFYEKFKYLDAHQIQEKKNLERAINKLDVKIETACITMHQNVGRLMDIYGPQHMNMVDYFDMLILRDAEVHDDGNGLRRHLDWHFAVNQFHNCIRRSNIKAYSLFADHHAKLLEDISDAEITPLYNRFNPLFSTYRLRYRAWWDERRLYKDKTRILSDLQGQMEGVHLNEWHVAIQNVYAKETQEYARIFPNGLEVFHKFTRDNIYEAVGNLAMALVEFPDLSDVQAEVQAYYGDLIAARVVQQRHETRWQASIDGLYKITVQCATVMYKNMGMLMFHFLRTNKVRILNYFQMDIIRSKQSVEEGVTTVEDDLEAEAELMMEEDVPLVLSEGEESDEMLMEEDEDMGDAPPTDG